MKMKKYQIVIIIIAWISIPSILCLNTIIKPSTTVQLKDIELFDYGFIAHENASAYRKLNITLYFPIQLDRNLTVSVSVGYNHGIGARYINQPSGTYELTFNCFLAKNYTCTIIVKAFKIFKQTIVVT